MVCSSSGVDNVLELPARALAAMREPNGTCVRGHRRAGFAGGGRVEGAAPRIFVMPGIAVRRTASLPFAYVPAMKTSAAQFWILGHVRCGGSRMPHGLS